MKKTLFLPMVAVLTAVLAPVAVFSTDNFVDVGARAAIIYEPDSGRILWQKNPFEPLPMASTTKIMTAVVALENGDLDSTVDITDRAAKTPPVKMGVTKGEKIPLRDLLYALMLQSSNDAATAIAEHVGGTVEGFCDMMTLKAQQIGALETVFVTPNGLDAENHHSCAYDMAIIAAYALSNDAFRDIISTKDYHAQSDRCTYDIVNKDRFLYEYPGALGIKTGYTGGAGHCFVGAAERDGMTLITVVLASGWGGAGRERKWVDTKSLMNFGFRNFTKKPVIRAGEKAGTVRVVGAKADAFDVYFGRDVTIALAEGERGDVSVEIVESTDAPVKRGDFLGRAKVTVGETVIEEMDLYAAADIDEHSLKNSARRVVELFAGLCSKRGKEVR